MRAFYMLITLVTGAWIALHVTMNAKIAKITGMPAMVNLCFWICGALSAVVLTSFQWNRGFLTALSPVPKWLFLAGCFGAMIALIMNIVIPVLGIDNGTMLLMAGQIVAAMILGHIGFLNTDGAGITPVRIMGCLIMLAGAALVIYGRLPFVRP